MPGRFDLASYVDVQERINRFWTEHPDGSIVTRIESLPDEFERVLFRCEVYKHRDDTRPSATGYAAEIAGGSGANLTSWHENAETSGVGRALANMGYAKTRDDRPSRQEMQKVERGRPTPQPSPQAPPRDASAVPTSTPKAAATVADDWTAFWGWARSQGLNGAKAVEAHIGEPTAGQSPAQLRQKIEAVGPRAAPTKPEPHGLTAADRAPIDAAALAWVEDAAEAVWGNRDDGLMKLADFTLGNWEREPNVLAAWQFRRLREYVTTLAEGKGVTLPAYPAATLPGTPAPTPPTRDYGSEGRR